MAHLSFDHFYPATVYQAFCHSLWAYRSSAKGDPLRPNAVDAWLDSASQFDSALLAFMEHKAQSGDLAPIAHSEGRHISWADSWNKLALRSPIESWEKEKLTSGCGVHLLSSSTPAMRPDPERLSGLIASSHHHLVAMVELGDFHLMGEREKCNLTGQSLGCELVGWRARLFATVKNTAGSWERQAIQSDPPPLRVEQFSVPAPSGRILLCDWPRIDEFTQAVTENHHADSVNLAHGRIGATRRYAEEFGFMSVSVGNTSPSILARDSHFCIAQLAEDGAAEGAVAGCVCTDLWWATAIDFDTLCSIVARATGAPEAHKIVLAHIAERGADMVEIRVEPGSTLYFSFHDQGLMRNACCHEVSDAGLSDIHATLSTRPLAWEPRASGPKRRLR
jgi:hypothetical protein